MRPVKASNDLLGLSQIPEDRGSARDCGKERGEGTTTIDLSISFHAAGGNPPPPSGYGDFTTQPCYEPRAFPEMLGRVQQDFTVRLGRLWRRSMALVRGKSAFRWDARMSRIENPSTSQTFLPVG